MNNYRLIESALWQACYKRKVYMSGLRLVAGTMGNRALLNYVTFWAAQNHPKLKKCTPSAKSRTGYMKLSGFKEAGLQVGVTTWARGSRNQS